MAVTARFYVREITQMASSGWAAPAPAGTIKLSVCTRGPENKEWATATPSGNIEMYVSNSPAWEWFQERLQKGEDVSVTFDVAPSVV